MASNMANSSRFHLCPNMTKKYIQCHPMSKYDLAKILWNSTGIRSARGTVQPVELHLAGDGLGIKLSVGVDQTANLCSWTLASQHCKSLGH